MYKHYFSLVVSQNFMFSMHTQGTQRENRIFDKIQIFFEIHTPYLWVIKCALWVRAQKKFFGEAKCIYLKNFSIIISLDGILVTLKNFARGVTHIS